MNPYGSFLEMQRQSWEQAADLAERLGAVPDANETIADVDVGGTPHEVVYEENKLQLYHYESQTEEQHDVPILIVYALINRPYILDLQPDRSVVRTLLENGFDVYLVDWGEPSLMDRSLTLEDYVTRYVDNCVDVVRERSGQDSINLLGYCMGGTMSVMYAALFPEKVRNLGLMAAGLCFENTGGVLERWGDDDYFDPKAVTGTFGNVPSDFLDVGFALMDPVENYVTKYVRFYENVEDEDFVENFARMEQWLDDGIDVAGATFEQFIEEIYQENKLHRNELYVGDRHVDLENVDMPVLNIVAEYDHLVPPEASKPFNEVVGSDDATTLEFATGHIGMSVSSRSHADLWPEVCEWFEERSEVGAEATADAAGGTPEAATDAAADTADTGESADAEPETDEPDPADAEDPDVEPDESDPGDAVEIEIGGEEDDLARLQDVEGIGPAYEDRLEDAGVSTVAQLATADATEVAVAAELPPARIEDWIDQARELLD